MTDPLHIGYHEGITPGIWHHLFGCDQANTLLLRSKSIRIAQCKYLVICEHLVNVVFHQCEHFGDFLFTTRPAVKSEGEVELLYLMK